MPTVLLGAHVHHDRPVLLLPVGLLRGEPFQVLARLAQQPEGTRFGHDGGRTSSQATARMRHRGPGTRGGLRCAGAYHGA